MSRVILTQCVQLLRATTAPLAHVLQDLVRHLLEFLGGDCFVNRVLSHGAMQRVQVERR